MTTTPSPWSVGRRKFQDARARRAAGSTEVSVCRSATLARVRQRRQHLALRRRRLGEHREGLVGVGGDHHAVVRRDPAVAVGDVHAIGRLGDRGDLAAGAHVGQRRGQPIDVLPGAAGDRAPLGRAEDAEHPVVLEEREQVARRVVQRDVRVAGPDRGDQRLHEVPLEVRREAAVGKEPAQRAIVVRPREQRPRSPMEARDLGEHPQVGAPREGAQRSAPARRDRAPPPTRGRCRRRGSTSTSPTAGWPRRARRTGAAAPGRCAGCAR